MASPCDHQLIYDFRMAYPDGDRCALCGLGHGPANNPRHHPRCPIGVLAQLTLRVRLGSSRYATLEAQGANPERIASKFMDSEVGYYWDKDPSPNDDIRVSLAMDLPDLVEPVRAAMKKVQAEVEARDEVWRIEGLQKERKKALTDLANRSSEYTAVGLAKAREKILNDRQYKDLPPVE